MIIIEAIVENGFYLQANSEIISEDELILLREEQLGAFYQLINTGTEIKPVVTSQYFGDHIKYVFGWKGTGKTTMIKYFAKKIRGPHASSIYINGRVYDTPTRLIENIKNKMAEKFPDIPVSSNEREFITTCVQKLNRQTFLLIDEVDKPLRNSKSQQKDEFLHFITRLTSENTKGNFKIIFTTNIANIERYWSQELKSYVGANKIVFAVYSVPELLTILEKRATKGLKKGSWDKKDLHIIAQLTFRTFEGDVRKALDLLNNLAKRSNGRLDISHLDAVVELIKKNDLHMEIVGFPHQAQIFLKALIENILPTKQGNYFKDEFTTEEAFKWYFKYCEENSENHVSSHMLYKYLNTLADIMILTKASSGYKLREDPERLNQCLQKILV